MDAAAIKQLAFVLRQNGDTVLNGHGKLSLSGVLLRTLNESFSLVTEQRDSLSSSFQVINNSNNTDVDLFSDLQFLHDFLQRSVSLKLIPGVGGEEGAADIGLFKNLRFLELHRVSAASVVGMERLRGRLQVLVCVRSVGALRDVLEQGEGPWGELKEAVFRQNGIRSLDNSLELAPWLHTVDLSHNEIGCADGLSCLGNLKRLNLSFNRLERVPQFVGQICGRLQVLILKGNFIETLKPLAHLANLCELDLSDNCLLDHHTLSPLSHLAALKYLNLTGNPLTYHPQHRPKTISYLHTNTNTVHFLLNGMIVSKSEQKLVGTLHCAQQELLCSSIASDVGGVGGGERLRRVRDALISEGEEPKVSEEVAEWQLTTSVEHLETKRQIKELRERYGEGWLQQQAGSQLQEALGLEKTQLPATSSPYESDFLLHAHEEMVSSENTFATAVETVTIAEDSSVYARGKEGSSSEEDIDLGDGDESIYLVRKKGGGGGGSEDEQLFVVITKNRIYERDSISSKVKSHWHIESLVNCEGVQEEEGEFLVRLDFETLRKDKKRREYVMERGEAGRLVDVLQGVLENRVAEEDVVVYQCMKCSQRFSAVDEALDLQRGKQRVCPACESTLVIQQED